jgi:hypothetical protein
MFRDNNNDLNYFRKCSISLTYLLLRCLFASSKSIYVIFIVSTNFTGKQPFLLNRLYVI